MTPCSVEHGQGHEINRGKAELRPFLDDSQETTRLVLVKSALVISVSMKSECLDDVGIFLVSKYN